MRQMNTPLPGISGGIPRQEDPEKLDFLTRFQEDVNGDVFGTIEGDVCSSMDRLDLSLKHREPLSTPRTGNLVLLHNLDFSSQPSSGGMQAPLSEAGDTETNATQMDFDGLEDLDNIFGADESGIHHKLLRKQQQLLADAEKQDRHYQTIRGSLNAADHFASESTLVNIQQKAHGAFQKRQDREDSRNIRPDYELTTEKHGGDNQGAGELMAPITISKQVRPKASLPAFSNPKPNLRRFRSTVGFAIPENAIFDKSIGDGVNYDTDVKRKLERIPSFYTKNVRSGTSDPQHDRKAQVLSAYREPDFASPIRVKMGHVQGGRESSHYVPSHHSRMKFDVSKNQWVGNDIDLVRFEAAHPVAGRGAHHNQGNANMVYDEVNMRWVNLDEESTSHAQDAIFEDIPDLNSPIKPIGFAQRGRGTNDTGHAMAPPVVPRTSSTYTQRTVSSNAAPRGVHAALEFEFEFLAKQVERFEREAEKLARKTSHWFLELEVIAGQAAFDFSHTYKWDIRKMVIENR